jgi:TPR repeat protein
VALKGDHGDEPRPPCRTSPRLKSISGSSATTAGASRTTYATAASWFRKAAEQGEADAQGHLGAMYAQGQGVPQDYVTAHMWLDLAAASGDKNAVIRDMIAAQMTPEQIAEAQKLARQ